MSRYNIGMMQGRLSPRLGNDIQFFPFGTWQQEFEDAAQLGLDEIEFIFDYDRYPDNPLWTPTGVQELKQVMDKTGIAVRSVCFDYFMRRPFFKRTGEQKNLCYGENLEIARRVIQNMKLLGIKLLEIPLVDDSSLKTKQEEVEFMDYLNELLKEETWDFKVGLETDLPPQKFASYLKLIGRKCVGANYDSGNSSGIGYDCYEEISVLNNYIFNIHIKDRRLHGPTVELGTGNADFDKLFAALHEINYQGSFILQAARGEDGQETDTILRQKLFVLEQLARFA